jgi:hypothetical protein
VLWAREVQPSEFIGIRIHYFLLLKRKKPAHLSGDYGPHKKWFRVYVKINERIIVRRMRDPSSRARFAPVQGNINREQYMRELLRARRVPARE